MSAKKKAEKHDVNTEIPEGSQGNPADVGVEASPTQKAAKPFDHEKGLPGDGLPEGMVLNPADQARAGKNADEQ